MRRHRNLLDARRGRVAEHLAAEFDGLLSQVAVEAEVEVAELELRGQVPAGAWEEMLHRLAGHRLRERAGARR
ncbi:hypothetical protein ACQPWY_23940 [Pseudonocardia xinjiangensis]|uniref:hypothetical protein n=1 Tax=Pseudonocardia xinjiangensis TaxID=75289 RepID=UPI003D93E980